MPQRKGKLFSCSSKDQNPKATLWKASQHLSSTSQLLLEESGALRSTREIFVRGKAFLLLFLLLLLLFLLLPLYFLFPVSFPIFSFPYPFTAFPFPFFPFPFSFSASLHPPGSVPSPAPSSLSIPTPP